MNTPIEHTHEFTCSVCKQHKTHTSTLTTGYGMNKAGEKICYACCGELDAKEMRETGRATLYLSFDQEPRRYGYTGWIYPQNRKVTNWPGTLSINLCSGIKVGRHNIAGRRFDFWFMFEGEEWHGVQYGDRTQIARCHRLKAQQKAA